MYCLRGDGDTIGPDNSDGEVRYMSLDSAAQCDWPGCGALRREVNRWYVVVEDSIGVYIYHWETCPPEAMALGKHFCGLAHAFQYASKVLTPDETKVDRETTLELKPPLTREGTKPEAEQPQEGTKDEGLDH
jgi:hypothetical protein